MAKGGKLLAGMRANPNGDWTISNVETVCNAVDCATLYKPKRGSHYVVRNDKEPGFALSIPARRPIKAVYIKRFVDMLDSIIEE